MTTQREVQTGDNDLNWVHKHLEELEQYEGKWIAVLNHVVLTASDDASDVVDFLGARQINGALLFEVPADVHRKVYLIG